MSMTTASPGARPNGACGPSPPPRPSEVALMITAAPSKASSALSKATTPTSAAKASARSLVRLTIRTSGEPASFSAAAAPRAAGAEDDGGAFRGLEPSLRLQRGEQSGPVGVVGDDAAFPEQQQVSRASQ